MLKATIIGDCHSNRLLEHWKPEDLVHFKIWGRAGQSAWGFNTASKKLLNRESSKIEKLPNFLTSYDSEEEDKNQKKLKSIFSSIVDEGIVFSWLGYIDIKIDLPENDDTEECVIRYISSLKNYFKKAKVVVIEPFPQFIPYIGIKEENLKEWSWEERKKYNNEFIHYLKKHSAGFAEIITQEQIFNFLKIKQNDMTIDIARKNEDGTISDALNSYYMKKIYDYLTNFVLKM